MPALETPRSRLVGWAVLYVAVGLIAFGVVAVLISTNRLLTEVRNTQLEGTPTGQKLLQSSERILDCTDPDGECTKRNQEQTVAVVGDIQDGFIRVVAAAAACSVEVGPDLTADQREVQISACITKRLAAAQP